MQILFSPTDVGIPRQWEDLTKAEQDRYLERARHQARSRVLAHRSKRNDRVGARFTRRLND